MLNEVIILLRLPRRKDAKHLLSGQPQSEITSGIAAESATEMPSVYWYIHSKT